MTFVILYIINSFIKFIVYQYYLTKNHIYFYKLSTKRVLNFTTLFVLLSTILNLRGQNVDKWQFSVKFCVDKILANPYTSYYLPQHCLYFFPLPHAGQISILSILITLCLFPLFSKVCGQVTFYILSTIFVIFYIKYSSNVHKLCTNF